MIIDKKRTVKIYKRRKFVIIEFDNGDYYVALKSNLNTNTVEYNAEDNIVEVLSDNGNVIQSERYDEKLDGDLVTHMMDLCLIYEDEDWEYLIG